MSDQRQYRIDQIERAKQLIRHLESSDCECDNSVWFVCERCWICGCLYDLIRGANSVDPDLQGIRDRQPVATPAPGEQFVYELSDSTDEDAYYTLGLFPTFDEALSIAESGDQPCGYEPEEKCVLAVRERTFGRLDLSSGGRVVAEVHWEQEINDDGDWEWSVSDVRLLRKA